MKTMNKLYTLCVALPLILISIAAPAQDASLYEQAVPVPDDSEQSLISGRRDAMAAVLVKVSAERGVAANAAVGAALDKAADYVPRYGFRTAGAGGLALWAAFDPAAIDRLLASVGASQWRGARPDALVWLISKGPDGLLVEASDGGSAVVEVLQRRAGERGLQVVLPMRDLEDRQALSAAALWANETVAVRAASQRYRVGLVMVGRMEQGADGLWSGRWTVYQGTERRDWSNSAASRADLVAAAVDWNADSLSAVYAGGGSGGGGGSMVLRVGGLGSFGDYLRVSSYLQRLGAVASVRPLRLSSDSAEFDLGLAGSRQGLQRILALEGVLAQEATADGGGADYRLLR
jgi:hypothetical protein